ncbi:MAG TPA: hemolysin family protein, partial [Gaiellaceae bacterium]|nr:hemolysin family protein [Gaiellaceae bacterium]
IGTVQVGISALGIGLGALGEPTFRRIFDPLVATGVSIVLALVVTTYLYVVLGELVPRVIALDRAEVVAARIARPLALLGRMARPIVWLLQGSATVILRPIGFRPISARLAVRSEEELRGILAEAEETGIIEEAEEEMLYKVFDFADTEVREVMVPRPNIAALSAEMPMQECLAVVIDSPYTRYPVYRESLDEIVGILHVRDLFSALVDRGIAGVQLQQLLRPAHIVPETKDLAALLTDFRRTNQHMAIVVDEYGELEGIVTLEDLLEEIVGDIEDEFDLPDESVEKLPDGRLRIGGTFPIDDFNEQFGRALPIEDYHTIGGFVFGLLGRAPEPGDEVAADGCRFEVLEVEGSRIERLEVELVPEEPGEGRLEEVS